MFLDKFIPLKYLVKSEIFSVELRLTEVGSECFYTLLKIKKKQLELVETGSFENINSLPDKIIKRKIPLTLILSGKGVIVKKINVGESSHKEPNDIIKENLPGLNLSDFYVQIYEQTEAPAFIAFCRRELVDEITKVCSQKKIELAEVLLSSSAIIGLEPLWEKHNTLIAGSNLAELTNGHLDTLKPLLENSAEYLIIDGLKLKTEYTLAFAGGVSYIFQNKITRSNNSELSEIRTRHVEKNKIRFLTLVVVGIAFTIAIVNVIAYLSFFEKKNKLEAELAVYQNKHEQINKILNDYQNNKNLIESAGILNKSSLSEFVDKIAGTLPDDVVLSEMYINPKKHNEFSEDSLITFVTKQLILKGYCAKSFVVNEWVHVLKMQNFIKNVSLEKFKYDGNEFQPNFEIRLMTD